MGWAEWALRWPDACTCCTSCTSPFSSCTGRTACTGFSPSKAPLDLASSSCLFEFLPPLSLRFQLDSSHTPYALPVNLGMLGFDSGELRQTLKECVASRNRQAEFVAVINKGFRNSGLLRVLPSGFGINQSKTKA